MWPTPRTSVAPALRSLALTCAPVVESSSKRSIPTFAGSGQRSAAAGGPLAPPLARAAQDRAVEIRRLQHADRREAQVGEHAHPLRARERVLQPQRPGPRDARAQPAAERRIALLLGERIAL